jgi:hypothetical protein
MIISIMDDFAGFFSLLFFAVNHYIYCKKNNISFQLDTTRWLFKSEKGWTDYFQDVNFTGTNELDSIRTYKHSDLLGDFFIHEYRDILLKEFYLYNDEIREKIMETKQKLNLTEKGTYDSLFIRRGDKLCFESKYYSTEQYVDLLLEKNPLCKTIFLQTDDYNCFLDIEKYISEKNLDIQLVTLCDPQLKGIVVFKKIVDYYMKLPNEEKSTDEIHNGYIDKVTEDLKITKTVDNMNSEEKYQHTLTMLIGIDIVLHSKYCILDNQSNVSRFICITHDTVQNVFDIRFPNENYDMNRTRSPAYN